MLCTPTALGPPEALVLLPRASLRSLLAPAVASRSFPVSTSALTIPATTDRPSLHLQSRTRNRSERDFLLTKKVEKCPPNLSLDLSSHPPPIPLLTR